jgi:mannan endo-1,4-beta-mannosidase
MRYGIAAAMATVTFVSVAFAQEKVIRLDAEKARRTGVTLATSPPSPNGPSRGSYLTDFRNDGDQAVFEADLPAGFYDMRIRYRSLAGPKAYDVEAGGIEFSGTFEKTSEAFKIHEAGMVELPAGHNSITLKKGWGFFEVDYIELAKTTPPKPPVAPPAQPCDKQADASAQALMAYLTKTYGHFTLSGVYTFEDADHVQEVTGKYPAIMAGDFLGYSPSRVAHGDDTSTKGVVEKLIEAARKGSLITMSWHWNAPAGLIDKEVVDERGNKTDLHWYMGFYANATTFNIEQALAKPDSDDYRLLLRDIDAIAVQLKKFSDAGVPVLWRPLHEADARWFWWGAKGPLPTKKLWRLMYERLTQYHHLHNLIWVCNMVDPAWYPGDDVVDIVSIDTGGAFSNPLAKPWRDLQQRFAGKKMLAISELGKGPDLQRMHRYGVWWSYVVSWNHVPRDMTNDELKSVYSAPGVLTREQLPKVINQPHP